MFMINILGMDLWANGHVHDEIVYGKLFSLIVQILGYALNAYGIVHRTGKEENTHGVKIALKTLEIVPHSKIILCFFYLNP